MITLINATNRPDNQTKKVVDAYQTILKEANLSYQIFNLSDLPTDFVFGASFGQSHEAMSNLVRLYIDGAQKFIIVAPEYNGSYPGILKAFFDAIHPKHFNGKKAALVGVASGRAGNLRGMDHLTDVLHHLAVEVLSLKVPISKLDALLDEAGNLTDEQTLHALKRQMQRFLHF